MKGSEAVELTGSNIWTLYQEQVAAWMMTGSGAGEYDTHVIPLKLQIANRVIALCSEIEDGEYSEDEIAQALAFEFGFNQSFVSP